MTDTRWKKMVAYSGSAIDYLGDEFEIGANLVDKTEFWIEVYFPDRYVYFRLLVETEFLEEFPENFGPLWDEMVKSVENEYARWKNGEE